MTIYKVTLDDGQVFHMSGNFAEASANIKANWFPDDEDAESHWHSTPYQTADARHSPMRGAELVAKYFAEEDDCIDVYKCETFE